MCVCVCVCVCVCSCACVCVCMHACVSVCVCACVCSCVPAVHNVVTLHRSRVHCHAITVQPYMEVAAAVLWVLHPAIVLILELSN